MRKQTVLSPAGLKETNNLRPDKQGVFAVFCLMIKFKVIIIDKCSTYIHFHTVTSLLSIKLLFFLKYVCASCIMLRANCGAKAAVVVARS